MSASEARALEFSPADPFPLFPLNEHSYYSQQLHSQAVDAWLGFEIDRIETELQQNVEDSFERQEQWIGLKPAALQTPYTEIRAILELIRLAPGNRVVDLGAAYGRMGQVMQRHYPENFFSGFERCRERVEEGNRVSKNERTTLVVQDLTDPAFEIPPAEFYFLYDFGTKASIAKVLQKLMAIGRSQPICVIGRGRSSRDQIEQNSPWLSQIVQPEHYPHFSIYRNR